LSRRPAARPATLGWTVAPRRTAAMLDEPFDAFEDDDVDDMALVEFL